MAEFLDVDEQDREFLPVLESAAHLQQLVPDAVLVGGSAAIIYAKHRQSMDHDHVVADLADRFEMVLEAVEADSSWATNRVTPGKVILGNLDGIETGVRQMIRKTPLETCHAMLPSGRPLTLPTEAETLRIKGFLAVRRNQVRDFLDIAALANHIGVRRAADVLSEIDTYYADQLGSSDGIASQLARQLSDPKPADAAVIGELSEYRRLDQRWTDWQAVREVLGQVAAAMCLP